MMTRDPLPRLRLFLAALLAFGMLGSLTELLLLHHYEDSWQFVPLVLIGTALIVLVWHLFDRSALSVRMLQTTMALFLVAGLTGVFLHYQANVEFQVETNPSLSGWALFVKAIQAKVPPALAPGLMAQLGLLGLAYSYRHPSLRSES